MANATQKAADQAVANKDQGIVEDDIEIVEVDAAGKPLVADKTVVKNDKKDEQSKVDDEVDDDPEDEAGGDTRLANESNDNTADNRRTRQNRNEARRIAKQRDKTEIAFLRRQNELLERRIGAVETRTNENQVGSIDGQIHSLKTQLGVAEDVIAKAVENKNGEDTVNAIKIRDEIKEDIRKLEDNKGRVVEANKNGERRTGPDNAVVHNTQIFFSKVPWYNPTQGADEDSDTIRDIEAGMVARGSDPRTATHWQNLEARVKKQFKGRFETGEDDGDEHSQQNGSGQNRNGNGAANKNGGPRLPANGQDRGGSPRNQFMLSPERKQAMQDAGVWDDLVLRKRYIKRYSDYDRDRAARTT